MITVAQITPVSDFGRESCPFNCAECVYFNGLLEGEIDCGLDEEPKEDENL